MMWKRKTTWTLIFYSFSISLAVAAVHRPVWVAHSGSSYVSRVDTESRKVTQHRVGALPFGVAVDRKGNLWVSLTGADAVAKVNPMGKLLGKYPVGAAPMGIVINRDDTVWVCHYGSKYVCRLDSKGKILGNFNADSAGRGMTADKYGNIWMAQLAANRLMKLDSEGNFLGFFPVERYPYGVAADAEGNIWAVNALADHVSKLNQRGRVIGHFKVGHYPRCVAVDGSGFIWVTNKLENTVSRLDSSGKLTGLFEDTGWPFGISVDFDGNIWTSNRKSYQITSLNPKGKITGIYDVGPKPYSVGDATGFALANFVLPAERNDKITDTPISQLGKRVDRFIDLAEKLETSVIFAPSADYVKTSRFVLEKIPDKVIYQHPPSKIMFENVPIYKNAVLEFGIALAPKAWHKNGDGVRFDVFVGHTGEKKKLVFSRHIAPNNIEAERKWLDYSLALQEYEGANVNIVFTTSPGPTGNNANDWAGWSYPRIISDGGRERVLPEKPFKNVIFVTVDSLRADMLECYGNMQIKTASICDVAQNGVKFERCYTQSTSSAGALSSIFTSLYPKDHGVYDHMTAISTQIETLAEVFQSNGFDTAAFTSRGLYNTDSGFSQGFSDFFQGPSTPPFRSNAAQVNKAVLPWIVAHSNKPFFLWIHYSDTLAPYAPPSSEDAARQLNKTLDETNENADRIINLYKDSVIFLDGRLGELLSKLEKLNIKKDTLLVFVSTHGESLDENGAHFTHPGMGEEIVKVPLLFSGPDKAVVTSPVESIDIYPTVLDIMGIDIPTNIRGRTLLPLVNGQAEDFSFNFTEHADNGYVSFRSNKVKFIRHRGNPDANPDNLHSEGSGTLYLIRESPHKPELITEKRPELVKIYNLLLDAWIEDKLPGERSPETIDNPERIKMIDASGKY